MRAARRQPWLLRALERWIERRHTELAWIEASDLARWLDAPEAERPALLDVRGLEEFETGHLPGARRIAPGAHADAVPDPDGRDVVVYCSLGYRSARLGERLRSAGWRVHNLRGGIFRWALQGLPMLSAGRPVRQVHPFHPLLGLLLPRALRAPTRRTPPAAPGMD